MSLPKQKKSPKSELVPPFLQLAQARQCLAVLLAIRRALRAYDVRQRRHGHTSTGHLDYAIGISTINQ